MKTPPPPMRGEVLEEDLYDNREPFYDHGLQQREFAARKNKLEDLQLKHPPRASSTDGPAPKLKRKVIYVYETQEKPPANQVDGAVISKLA